MHATPRHIVGQPDGDFPPDPPAAPGYQGHSLFFHFVSFNAVEFNTPLGPPDGKLYNTYQFYNNTQLQITPAFIIRQPPPERKTHPEQAQNMSLCLGEAGGDEVDTAEVLAMAAMRGGAYGTTVRA